MNAQFQTTRASEQYFKILADGTQVPMTDPRTDHVAVLDTMLNLLFYPRSIGVNGRRARQEKLKEEVAKLDVLGSDWRMADADEAASIIRRDRYNPAVDTNLFPDIKPGWHVTSTPAAWAPASAAWFVDFYGGSVSDCNLVNEGWALAVRPAGQ